MTIEQKRVNKELVIILNKLNYINKIPSELYDYLRTNQDENWNFIYNDELALEYQPMKRQTAILLSNIYLKYICLDKYERERLKKIYIENGEKLRNIDYSKLLNRHVEEKVVNNTDNELLVPQKQNNSIWTKIKNWINLIVKKR